MSILGKFLLEKANPHHDEKGHFARAGEGGAEGHARRVQEHKELLGVKARLEGVGMHEHAGKIDAMLQEHAGRFPKAAAQARREVLPEK